MPRIAPEDRRLCVVLAYALMTLCETNRDRFEIITETILDSVPYGNTVRAGRELLSELLIIKGGLAKTIAAGLLVRLADDLWIHAAHQAFAWIALGAG